MSDYQQKREKRVLSAVLSSKHYSSLSLEEMLDMAWTMCAKLSETRRGLDLGHDDDCLGESEYRVYTRREWTHLSEVFNEAQRIASSLTSSICRIQQDEVPTDTGYYWDIVERDKFKKSTES